MRDLLAGDLRGDSSKLEGATGISLGDGRPRLLVVRVTVLAGSVEGVVVMVGVERAAVTAASSSSSILCVNCIISSSLLLCANGCSFLHDAGEPLLPLFRPGEWRSLLLLSL